MLFPRWKVTQRDMERAYCERSQTAQHAELEVSESKQR